jgi:hypothetical protein
MRGLVWRSAYIYNVTLSPISCIIVLHLTLCNIWNYLFVMINCYVKIIL